jgi:hypothetical protein
MSRKSARRVDDASACNGCAIPTANSPRLPRGQQQAGTSASRRSFSPVNAAQKLDRNTIPVSAIILMFVEGPGAESVGAS